VFVTGEAGSAEPPARRDAWLAAAEGDLACRPARGPLVPGESLLYRPFRDLLREGSAPDATARAAAVALRRNVDGLFPERGDEIYPHRAPSSADARAGRLASGPASPEALQYQTFEVVATVLRRLPPTGRSWWRSGPALGGHDLGVAVRAAPGASPRRPSCRDRPADERDHASWRLRELAPASIRT
jgi:hypothetical protein